MKKDISIKTIQYIMRIIGSILITAAAALGVYLIWIQSHVGWDSFFAFGYGVSLAALIGGSLMLIFSFRICDEEEQAEEMTETKHHENHWTSKRCG